MAPALQSDTPWFVHAFDHTWLRLYSHRNDAEARESAPYIVRLLGLHAGDNLLDIACGAGRYARAFAALGLRVTGTDLSEDLLSVARESSPGLPGAPSFSRIDSRKLPFGAQFAGAVLLFTSFGYFDTRAEDVELFRGARRALVPGGRFLLDFLNEAHVRANLPADNQEDRGNLHMQFKRRIDEGPAGLSVFKHVEVTDRRSGRPISTFEERVRLYTAAEVDGLLEDARLTPVGERLGDVSGSTHDAQSSRLVRVAERR
jgi:SAM-dependent methyltransferase